MSEKLNKNYNFRTERIVFFFYFFCILKLLQFNQQIEIFDAQFWFFFLTHREQKRLIYFVSSNCSSSISKLRFSMLISMLIFYLFIFLTNREQKRPASNIKLMLALNQSLACRKRQEKTVCFNILCSDPNRFNEFVYRTLEKFIFFGRPRRRMLKSVSVLPTLELFRILHF